MYLHVCMYTYTYIGIVVNEGSEGAKEELLDTLKYQAGSAAQVCVCVCVHRCVCVCVCMCVCVCALQYQAGSAANVCMCVCVCVYVLLTVRV